MTWGRVTHSRRCCFGWKARLIRHRLLSWPMRCWRGSGHPGFAALRAVFAELLGGMMGPLVADVRVPEGLLEVRNMLATRAETWKQQWLQEGKQKGEQEGRRKGEAAMLLRQLERRFGALPDWARDRIAAADTAALEEWGLRVLDAGSLDDVLA